MISEIQDEPMAKIHPDDWKTLETKIDATITSAIDPIQKSIEALQPQGWKKHANRISVLGPPIAHVAVIVALLAITIGALYQSYSHVEKETEFRTKTNDSLALIGTQLSSLRALISSNRPEDRQSQLAAKELLSEARRKVIPALPIPVVEDAGKKFIRVADSTPEAWSVALDFVAYRSDLNTLNDPGHQVDGPYISLFTSGKVDGRPSPKLAVFDIVKSPHAFARMGNIGTDLNAGASALPSLLVLTGGVASLDDQHVKNAVFQNVEIHYSGKATILENVRFINCVFVIDNDPPGRRLGETLLTASTVNFKSLA